MYNQRAVLWCLPIIEALLVFMGNMLSVDVATPENERQQSVNTASTEHQQSINKAPTNFIIASLIIHRLWYCIYP